MNVTTTDRGFDHMDPIPSTYGGEVSASESSAALAPHIWLRAKSPVNLNEPDGPAHDAVLHLTAANAWLLARQLMWLVANHYQDDARPDSHHAAEADALHAALLVASDARAMALALNERGFTVVQVGPDGTAKS